MNQFRVKFTQVAYWEYAKGSQDWDETLDSLIGSKEPLTDRRLAVEEFERWCYENRGRKFIELPVLYMEQQIIARFTDFIK